MLNYSDFTGRRGLSNLLRTEGHNLKDQDVDQDGRENVASGMAYLENKKCIHRWAVDNEI